MTKIDLELSFTSSVSALVGKDKSLNKILTKLLGKVNGLLDSYAKEFRKNQSASAADLSNLDVFGSAGTVHLTW
jgi:hypothetical protein